MNRHLFRLAIALPLLLATAFAHAQATTASFSRQSLHANDFTDQNLRLAKFDSANFFMVSFVRATLQNADFSRCQTYSTVFTGADVSGADFTDADLRNARIAGILNLGKAKLNRTKFRDLTGVSLTGADLRRANFVMPNFYKADLSKTDLRGADLIQANMTHANLRGADLRGANLTQTHFDHADLNGANLSGAILTQTNFSGADLRNCIGLSIDALSDTFVSAKTQYPADIETPPAPVSHFSADTLRDEQSLRSADLTALVLASTDLHELDLRNAALPTHLKGAILQGTDASQLHAEGADFAQANLDGTLFRSAYLAGARFGDATNLSTADFSSAYLDDAHFENAIAPNTKFTSAYLRSARFAGANLANADLSQTNLQGADFSNADLTGAKLTGADITGATFTKANLAAVDLRQTFGLSKNQLSDLASYDADKLPPRLTAKIVAAATPSPSSLLQQFLTPGKSKTTSKQPIAVVDKSANILRFAMILVGVLVAGMILLGDGRPHHHRINGHRTHTTHATRNESAIARTKESIAMIPPSLQSCVDKVPPGKWAVAVSGGADSVALLLLLHQRSNLSLHIVHLDHETRAGESAIDAEFVSDLAKTLRLPSTLKKRSAIEPTISKLPQNLSAKFRTCRMELFKQTVAKHNLVGVILAHHAADQAETVLQRLLRGSGATALSGMSERSTLNGVALLRPLLTIHPDQLREYLHSQNQPWREDSSNSSNRYERNRVRPILAQNPSLQSALLQLSAASTNWKSWLTQNTPKLSEVFQTDNLANLPSPLARYAASRWLAARGSPLPDITTTITDRLIAMCQDAATPAHQQFPGNLHVHRRRSQISCEKG